MRHRGTGRGRPGRGSADVPGAAGIVRQPGGRDTTRLGSGRALRRLGRTAGVFRPVDLGGGRPVYRGRFPPGRPPCPPVGACRRAAARRGRADVPVAARPNDPPAGTPTRLFSADVAKPTLEPVPTALPLGAARRAPPLPAAVRQAGPGSVGPDRAPGRPARRGVAHPRRPGRSRSWSRSFSRRRPRCRKPRSISSANWAR